MSRTNSLISRFPSFYRSNDRENVFYRFMQVFGEMLDQAEADAIRVMQSHWVQTADNLNSKGFDTGQKGDLDKIFSLYLENLGGTSLLKQVGRPSVDDDAYQAQIKTLIAGIKKRQYASKAQAVAFLGAVTQQPNNPYQSRLQSLVLDLEAGATDLEDVMNRLALLADPDVLYRERIMGLIQVLKNGASTKEGIISIVAANLGIVGDSPETVAARNLIRIEEYLPELVVAAAQSMAPYEVLAVYNPNAIGVIPEVRIETISGLVNPLINPTIRNLSNGTFVRYEGQLVQDEALSFFSDGTALLQGLSVPLVGQLILEPGPTSLRLEANLGLSQGIYDQSRFDFSLFDQQSIAEIGRFDDPQSVFDTAVFGSSDPVVDMQVRILELNPGSFRVRIPWDIPGFTDKFDDLPENPRNQIKYIVDKVKAAGVLSEIAYEKYFTEDQGLEISLNLTYPLEEDQEMEEVNFDIDSLAEPYSGGLEHELSDSLTLSGVFDYTSFDSLNTFG
ncbi:MAG: hypothetical protein AAGI38_12925 [Bacteroidota bacterium]